MIQLSDHFDYKRLIRFTLPSIAGMIFGSIYSIGDGFSVEIQCQGFADGERFR